MVFLDFKKNRNNIVKEKNFTVIGTHVKITSRLEGRVEKKEIIISTFTMAKVRGKFNVEAIDISNNDDNKIKSFKSVDKYYKVLDAVM